MMSQANFVFVFSLILYDTEHWNLKKNYIKKKKKQERNTQHYTAQLNQLVQSWHAVIFYFHHHQNFVDILKWRTEWRNTEMEQNLGVKFPFLLFSHQEGNVWKKN